MRIMPFAHPPLAAILSTALFLSVLPAHAQPADRSRQAAATLPESNEAILLTGRVEDALAAGDFRLALELLDQLRNHSAELIAPAASRTLIPIWRHVFRLQRQLPPGALDMYRRLRDAEAAAKFAAASRNADLAALREIFRAYPLTDCWLAVGRELAARLIDGGAYSEATEVLREMAEAGGDAGPEVLTHLAIALAAGGADAAAEAALQEAGRGLAAAPGRGFGERLVQVREWMARRAAGERDRAPGLRPAIGVGAWTQPLTRGDDPPEFDREIADAIEILRRMPLQEPVVAGDVLYLRGRGVIWALDALTLTVRWHATEQRLEGYLATGARFNPRAAETDPRLSPDAELSLTHHLRHVLSVGPNLLYSIEGLTLFDPAAEPFRQNILGAGAALPRNELVARSPATGRIVWRTGGESGNPLATVSFQDRPLVLGGDLVAPFVRDSELRLAILDPASGALRREVLVVGPPTHFTREGGRVLLTADDATLFVCTGNGVIAALRRADYSWQWATVYPSTLVEHLGQMWWQPQADPVESGVDRPIIADDLLIVAPADSTDIFALDRFDGHERWRFPRRDALAVAGASPHGLVLGGQGLSCVDLHDPVGGPMRWRSVPMELVGRPVVAGDRVFAPTREGIVSLDIETGKVVAAPEFLASSVRPAAASETGSVLGANLVAGAGAVFAVTPSKVIKLPDPGATESLARATGLPDTDARVAIPLAWCDALSGRLDAALRRLEQLSNLDAAYAGARDHVLAHVFLELARTTDSSVGRLDWLKRASALASDREFSARLALVIGRTLEEDGRWNEAAAHYLEMLGSAHAQVVPDPADPYRRAATWILAVGRLRPLAASRPDALAGALAAAVGRCDPVAEALGLLERLRVAVEGTSLESLVRVAMLHGRLPPELALDRQPDGDRADLPAPERRRIALARWEAHVGLEMLDEAARDAAAWKAEFAEASIAPVEAERERETLERIDQETRKISAARADPLVYDPALKNRRWRIAKAELLIDERHPLSAVRDWIPVRNYGAGQIQLIETFRNQFPWRQFEDGVGESGSTAPLVDTEFGVRPGFRVMEEEVRPRAWPVIVYNQLAAVPVRGGLVGTSLAPGRFARKRAWDFPVSDWTQPPQDIAKTSLGTRDGVVFCPRSDRLVLVGWNDGGLRWRRDFPGGIIQRVDLADSRIVVQMQDQQVFTLDAALGDRVQRLEPPRSVARAIEVVGERIIVWTADGARAYDAATLAPVWQSDVKDVARILRVVNSDWIAVRVHGEDRWRLLRSADGTPAIAAWAEGVEGLGDVHMFAVDAGLLLAVRGGDPDLRPTKLQFSAFDAAGGERRWSIDVKTGSLPVMNPSQLCGHPRYVVVLSDAEPAERDPAAQNRRYLSVQLIEKATGAAQEPIDIAGTFDPLTSGTCDPNVLVTPSRIIVQVSGNIVALGNPPGARSEP